MNNQEIINQVDAAIMEFQKHVRKQTGGNDFAVVDSTNLKQVILQALAQKDKEREEVVREIIEEIPDEMGIRTNKGYIDGKYLKQQLREKYAIKKD